MSEPYGTRNDCRRDNRATICPNSTTLGYSRYKAKRGSWVMFEWEASHRIGRVVGRVHCEGKTYLEVITMDLALRFPYVRWIDPATVRECYDKPARNVWAFMLSDDWSNADKILRIVHNGFSDSTPDGGVVGYGPNGERILP
jgi:hypothetical protein